MPNPNPEQFARVLLWHLCSARIEIASLKEQIDDFQKKLGHLPQKQSVQESLAFEKQATEKLYSEACKDIGLTEVPQDEDDSH